LEELAESEEIVLASEDHREDESTIMFRVGDRPDILVDRWSPPVNFCFLQRPDGTYDLIVRLAERV
jgi:hypothetical protein